MLKIDGTEIKIPIQKKDFIGTQCEIRTSRPYPNNDNIVKVEFVLNCMIIYSCEFWDGINENPTFKIVLVNDVYK